MRRGHFLFALLAASATLVVFFLLAGSPATRAQDAGGDLTFAGSASTGATISVTFTDDRTAITRVAILPSTLAYFDPTVPVVGGEFTVSVPDFSNTFPHRFGFVLEGSFVSETEVAGVGRSCGLIPPGIIVCTSDFTWSATGPVDTPPGPDDAVLEAAVEEGNGGIVLTTSPDGSGVTSFTLDGVSLPPCTNPDNPLDIRAFFDPPLPIAEDGSFSGGMALASLQFVSFTGTLLDGAAEGTLGFRAGIFVDDCTVEVPWSAAVLQAPEPTATPTVIVVGGLAVDLDDNVPPFGGPAPSELPATGDGIAQGRVWGVQLGLLVAAGLGLGAAAWRARRRPR